MTLLDWHSGGKQWLVYVSDLGEKLSVAAQLPYKVTYKGETREDESGSAYSRAASHSDLLPV